eukprot:TRINITY_DN71958_c0_g1_i1.p1 TRINITY_DN71958_c0_g1~~TRINITY_DN71958_c0_g1_i1.p1  ORF type:complete len:444 (+),score=31.72 TRINITY_DN71958_c0_g1_i1:53-1384(+)
MILSKLCLRRFKLNSIVQTSRRCLAPTSWHALSRSAAYTALPDTLQEGAVIRYPHRGRAHVLGPSEDRPAANFAISIIGASGSVGRQLAMSLVSKRRSFAGLGPMTVQFVGQRGDTSLATLIGLCSELRDAYEDFCPHLEVALDVEVVKADIIVMAAGASLSRQFLTHVDLARANSDTFTHHASALVQKNSNALVLVASNPVEFGVDTFVNAGFAPTQVLGTGAFLESLRFRREIASELGVPRQHVSGLVLGAHGLAIVPCWSTVHMAAIMADAEKLERLERLKSEGLARMPKDVSAVRKLAYEVRDLAMRGNALAAAALVNKQPPDIRATIRRYLSFFSGPSYPRVAIAEAVAEIITLILSGRETFAAGQMRMNHGRFLGIKGHAIGAPAIISGRGFELGPVDLLPIEEESIKASAAEIVNLSNTAEAKQLWNMIKRRASEK